MSKKEMDKRAAKGLTLRASDKEGEKKTITGTPIVYDQKTVLRDWYGDYEEVIVAGAGKNTLSKDNNIRALAHHDSSQPLGSTKHGTLKLTETKTGIDCEIDPPDTSAGRDIVENIKRGDVDGMSFGFYVVRDRWTFSKDPQVKDLREILEFELLEVSPVTFPAYAQTSVGLRAVGADGMIAGEELARLARRAQMGTISDGDRIRAEKLLKEFSESFSSRSAAVEAEQPAAEEAAPVDDTPKVIDALEAQLLEAEIEELEKLEEIPA